ncbi:MAG: response regulator [Candidatus Thiodiazotropha sp. (ex Lucinoma kastoroae)]|nr:response regulator [Candidatus Thiodiazotropha sp. (ex Rostrolucina anterorostrata)]MCU7859568.1 response regulator [Candidatus Thiodiazotropha sp. (ex Lucinoma kastoroae)]
MNECTKILIVETDKIIRAGISAYISEKRPNWLVHEAENGYEAMEVADQESISFFTIDYYLPTISGLDLIIELKRMHTTGKFILFTSPLPDHLKTEIEVLGVKRLDKPISEDTIVSMLKYFES